MSYVEVKREDLVVGEKYYVSDCGSLPAISEPREFLGFLRKGGEEIPVFEAFPKGSLLTWKHFFKKQQYRTATVEDIGKEVMVSDESEKEAFESKDKIYLLCGFKVSGKFITESRVLNTEAVRLWKHAIVEVEVNQ